MIPLVKIEFEVNSAEKVIEYLKSISIIKPKPTVKWYWKANPNPSNIGWFKNRQFLICPILEYWIQNRISSVIVRGDSKSEKEIDVSLELTLPGFLSLFTFLIFVILLFSYSISAVSLGILFVMPILIKILYDYYRDLRKTEKLITFLIEMGDK
jgi:hypothetical protein